MYAYMLQVRKMKAIYHILNQFATSSSSSAALASLTLSSSSSSKSLIGECWCPVKHLDIIHRALRRGTVRFVLPPIFCINNNFFRSGYCSSTPSLPVWPHCVNARRIRCQADLNSFPLAELEETTGMLRYYVDEDYPAGPGIIEPLPKQSYWCK